MKTLRYKGYIGSIEVSESDSCLYGQVLNVPDNVMISYEGETVAQLREDFQQSVDFYLESCREDGIKPQKTSIDQLNIKVPPSLGSETPFKKKC